MSKHCNVKENYLKVLGEIDKEKTTLIAVSKTKPVSMLQEAYDAGCRDFGENKVQELMEKIPALPKDIRWHMIGHLQKNKVKYIVDQVYLIHSVDSVELAKEIQKQAEKKNCQVNILLEVNVAEEDSKFGIFTDNCEEIAREIAKFDRVHIQGLMTVAPYVENSEENRPVFHKLRDLAVDIGSKNIDNVSMGILSMGMSNDYLVAASEGATYIRVGSSIFGNRIYAV